MQQFNRKQAAIAGATIYVGRPCKVCTGTQRYVCDAQCTVCCKARARVRRLRLRELVRAARGAK